MSFDAEFTEEELKLLEGGGDPPPASTDDPPAAADPSTAEPAKQAAEPAADLAVDAELEAFKAAHTGKTPEELIEIAFNQSKRAARTGFEARQVKTDVAEVARRATDALAQRLAKTKQDRADFDAQLESDPDAATRRLAHEKFDREEADALAEAERIQHEARIDEAFDLASRAIPDLQTQYPKIAEFGTEMGYSVDEVKGIADGRDLTVLWLASLAGNMMKAGVIDLRGNMVAKPAATATTDPRLTAPAALTTLSSAPGRAAPSAQDPASALKGLLAMSDDDFSKLSDDELARLTG